MKKLNVILAGVVLFAITVLVGCDKTSDMETPNNEQSITKSADLAEQEAAMDDIEEGINDEIDLILSTDFELTNSEVLKTGTTTCLTVSVDRPDDAKYPKVITLDFGTEGCEGRHGRVKKGKIIITKTGPHWTVGSEKSVVFENFFVNDNAVEGSKAYKNEGVDEDGNYTFSNKSTITVTTVEEGIYTRVIDKLRTQIAGADTPRYPMDDEFLITGTVQGTHSSGFSISKEITEPIHITRVCRFPVSGVVEIVKIADEVTTKLWLSYGNEAGDCLYTATVTNEAGESKTINLGKRFKK